MKIGCPNCGQHYEVEAGAIDRYYRCTECGEIFQGINAKSVKARRYRRKSKSAENTGTTDVPPPAAPTVPVPGPELRSDEAPPIPAIPDDDDVPAAASPVAAPDFSKVFDNLADRKVVLVPILMAALLLITLLILWFQTFRIARLDTENRKLAGRVERLSNELDMLKAALNK